MLTSVGARLLHSLHNSNLQKASCFPHEVLSEMERIWLWMDDVEFKFREFAAPHSMGSAAMLA